VAVTEAPNGIHYAMWGETRVSDATWNALWAPCGHAIRALERRAYYFVPLAIADTDDTMVAPGYTVDLGDRAICHRNAVFGSTEAVFLSTRLVEDRFGLAFEFFINVAHNFVEAAGVPESFSTLACSRPRPRCAAKPARTPGRPAATRRTAATTRRASMSAPAAPTSSRLLGFAAIYMLSLAVDFDYHDLRERDYPLLAASALAERLRHVASLFPANQGYEFQVLYRRKG